MCRVTTERKIPAYLWNCGWWQRHRTSYGYRIEICSTGNIISDSSVTSVMITVSRCRKLQWCVSLCLGLLMVTVPKYWMQSWRKRSHYLSDLLVIYSRSNCDEEGSRWSHSSVHSLDTLVLKIHSQYNDKDKDLGEPIGILSVLT